MIAALLAVLLLFSSCRPETELERQHRVQDAAARELERRRQPLDPESFLAHVRKGDLELVRLYLEAGMGPETTGADGQPALAAAVPHREVMLALLEAGADPNAPDAEHEPPLASVIRLGGHYELAELLLDRGADPDAAGHNGYTPLMYAVDLPRLARLLLERGASPAARDALGRSVLLHAVSNSEDAELVQLLLGMGADPNVAGHDGQTPLMWAAGNPEMVKLLLAARKAQVEESVRLLRAAGARR
jgi:ankyrin repeat protein